MVVVVLQAVHLPMELELEPAGQAAAEMYQGES